MNEEVKETEAVDEEVVEEAVEGKQEDTKVDAVEDKTYTQKEVEKMVQSQTDKRVSEAVKTRENNLKDKWEAEYAEKLEKEKSEAEKLASMSAEERSMAEFKQERDSWLEEKKEFEKERLQLETTKLLNAEGLPISFVDYIVGDTAEDVTENVATFKEEWKKALEKEVAEKLKGRVPSGSALQTKNIVDMTKKDFGNLPYNERERMLKIDPDILQKLKN